MKSLICFILFFSLTVSGEEVSSQMAIDCVKQGAVINTQSYLNGINRCLMGKVTNSTTQVYTQGSELVKDGSKVATQTVGKKWNELQSCFSQVSSISEWIRCIISN